MLRRWIQPIRFVIQVGFIAGLIIPWMPHSETVAEWLFWTVLVAGVFFCGWICPCGAAQDWLAWIARKVHLPRFQLSWRFQKYAQISRYVWAGLVFFAGVHYSFLSARFYFNDNLFHGMLTRTSGLILLFFLLLSLFTDRPFCNYFCMKGAIDGAMSVVRPIGIRRNAETCINCHLCEKACPMHVRVAHTDFVRHPNCINCLKCIEVCPKKCLAFRLMRLSKKKTNGTQ